MSRFFQQIAGGKREAALFGWIASLAFGAAGLSAALVLNGFGVGHPTALAVLAVLAVGAEHESIRLRPGVEVSVASILCVFAAVVFGPLAAIIVVRKGLTRPGPFSFWLFGHWCG